MENLVIRAQMKKANVRQWEVADRIGISEFTFTRWLRKELSIGQQRTVLDAIHSVAKQKHGEDCHIGIDL